MYHEPRNTSLHELTLALCIKIRLNCLFNIHLSISLFFHWLDRLALLWSHHCHLPKCSLIRASLNFHLYTQSGSITTNVLCSIPRSCWCIHDTTSSDKVYQRAATIWWLSSDTLVPQPIKTDRYCISEIWSEVALNTHKVYRSSWVNPDTINSHTIPIDLYIPVSFIKI